jgi:hypothetical protein
MSFSPQVKKNFTAERAETAEIFWLKTKNVNLGSIWSFEITAPKSLPSSLLQREGSFYECLSQRTPLFPL